METRTCALAITGLVALSAVVVGTVPAGTAATDAHGRSALRAGPPAQTGTSVADLAPRGRWNPTTSTGEIILDSRSYYTVFRGERDVTGWRRASDDGDVSGTTLTGEGGAAEGEVLSLDSSIPRDQPTGRYSGDQLTATVVSPRITSLDVINPNGVELGDDVSVGSNQRLMVMARWNYVGAEDLQVDLVRDGVNYEGEALSTAATPAQAARLPDGFGTDRLAREVQGPGSTGYAVAVWLFDFGDLPAGTYTLRVEGVDDLTFGAAAATIGVRIGGQGTPALSLDRRSVTRGAEVKYTITGSEAGRFHAVSLPRSRLRSSSVDPARAFRRVGDVVTTGTTADAAYAVVEIPDDGIGIGTVDTSLLDAGTTRLTLHPARESAAAAAATVSNSSGVRTESLDVEPGGFATNLGSFEYVIGSAIDVRGTADGPDYVALYVRDGGQWELLTLDGDARTPVGPDGVWEAENVRLSEEGPGGRLLSVPGSYRLAVVDADGFSGTPPNRLSTTDLNRLTNAQTAIRTVAPGATYIVRVGSVGGEVAQGDTLTVRGTAPGADEVALVFVDERGRVQTEVAPVARDNTFEERVGLDDLGRGRVTALVVSPGRDRVFGTGSVRAPDGTTMRLDSARAFTRYAESLAGRGLTGDQIVARIDGDVLRTAASDDLVSRQTFHIASPRTEVRDVVPATTPNATGVQPIAPGETTLVRGTTNRNPRDATITVEVVDSEDDTVADATVRAWGGDGVWTTTLTVPADTPPGTYALRIDDGENVATRNVQIRAREPTATPTEVPTTASPTPTAGPTTTGRTTTGATTSSPTTGGGPGFGTLAALCALVLVALAGLATRRR
ncbi:MAG: HVO_2072 family ArtA-dependent S-layer glycoprotein [Haloferacaceae archaeon]